MFRYLSQLTQTEKVTDVVAVAGVSSYWWVNWMPWINDTILVPLATLSGIIWLITQIYYKIRKENHDED